MKATHSKSQKQTRLPIRYLYFILSFKPLIDKEVIKVFQNYKNNIRARQINTENNGYRINLYYFCKTNNHLIIRYDSNSRQWFHQNRLVSG